MTATSKQAQRGAARAVHQLVITLEYGDAISAAVLRTQRFLRQLGFVSEIFTDHVDADLRLDVQPTAALADAVRPADAVMYHLAIGNRLAQLFGRLRARRVVVYHNITPPEFFLGASPEVARWLASGLQDVLDLAPGADLVIADSSFNLRDAVRAGARRTVVVPPPLDVERLHPRLAHGSSPPLILFVGRVAPNKRHDVLVRALAVLHATTDLRPRLALLGSAAGAGAPAYLESVQDLARRLHVDDSVVLDGRRLGDGVLGDWYAQADCFAVASEHEGFCVPAVESMAFGLPLVAHAAGALPETTGGAALLLHSLDPLLWAGAFERVLTDTALRGALRMHAERRYTDFSDDSLRARLGDALASVAIAP